MEAPDAEEEGVTESKQEEGEDVEEGEEGSEELDGEGGSFRSFFSNSISISIFSHPNAVEKRAES